MKYLLKTIPLPFLDKMIEQLRGISYFRFLDEFFGFYQISKHVKTSIGQLLHVNLELLLLEECFLDYVMRLQHFNDAC